MLHHSVSRLVGGIVNLRQLHWLVSLPTIHTLVGEILHHGSVSCLQVNEPLFFSFLRGRGGMDFFVCIWDRLMRWPTFSILQYILYNINLLSVIVGKI